MQAALAAALPGVAQQRRWARLGQARAAANAKALRQLGHVGLEGFVAGVHVVARSQVLVGGDQLALRALVGLPVVLADGFEHALGHLRQRRGVVLFEPFARAQAVAVVHIGLVELLPLVVAHHVAVHHLPAPEVVDGVEHLQCAAVALLHHFLHPVGVLVHAAQLGGHELLGRLQARTVGVAHVGDVELRVLAIQVLDGQRDAAGYSNGWSVSSKPRRLDERENTAALVPRRCSA